jgi:ankyrin repeat domain-containing protein 50
MLINDRFRWVVCQIDMLRKCFTLHALRKALNSLPKTLDETYERILMNIDEIYISDVRKILQVLTFSTRPVKLVEMVEVLAIDWDTDEPYFDSRNRIPDPNDIFTMCSTLVTSSNSSRAHRFYGDKRKFGEGLNLRLAHSSVKEYLISGRIKASKASTYSMDATSAHIFIASTHLTYLMSPAFEIGFQRPWTLSQEYREWPLFQTARDYWPKHINDAGPDLPESTKNLIQRFFDSRHKPNGGQYSVWIASFIPDASTETILNTPPLYYAASFGMVTVVRMLLATMLKSEIDIKGGRTISTPLHAACYRRHLPVVKLLLEAGADPNSVSKFGESCMVWGNEDIRRLLQQYGARQAVGGVKLKHRSSMQMEVRNKLRMMKLQEKDSKEVGAPGVDVRREGC